jgi:hypothetical protein
MVPPNGWMTGNPPPMPIENAQLVRDGPPLAGQ